MFREIQDQTLPSLLVTYLLKFTVILVVRHYVGHLIYKIGSDSPVWTWPKICLILCGDRKQL